MTTEAPQPRTDRRDLWFIALVVVAGVALRLPSIWTVPLTDDLVQHGMVAGIYGGEFAPWDLYAILPAEPSIRASHMELGLVPWWTAPQLDGHMFRPLTSLTLWLDHTLLPRAFVMHHVHTLLWWGATLAMAALVLRRLLSRPIAWLATVFFALDHGVSLPLAWLANRSVLVAGVLGLIALHVHVRWRDTGSRRGGWWSLCAMTLAFTAGEYAFCAVAYVVVYELVRARGRGLRAAWLGVLPAVLPAAVYAIAHVVGGHGIQGGENYVHPVYDPGSFVSLLPVRVPAALAELVASVPSSPLDFGLQYVAEGGSAADLREVFALHLIMVIGAIVLAAVVTLLGWPALGASERGAVAALGLGAALAVVPLAAAPMQGRLLLLPHLGGDAWAAAMVVAGVRMVRGRASAGWVRRGVVCSVGIVLLGFHVVLDLRASIREMARLRAMAESVPKLVASLRGQGVSIEGRRVVLLGSEVQSLMVHGTLVADAFGLERPRSWHVVSATHAPMNVHRTGPNVLEVWHLKGESWLDDENDRMFCPPPWEIPAGTQVHTGAFEVEVLEDRGGRPTRLRLTFDQDLDAAGVVFLVQTRTGLHRFVVPRVGGTSFAPIPGPAWESM